MDSSEDNQTDLDFDDSVTITVSDITSTDTYTLDPLYGALPSIAINPKNWTTTGTSGSWTFDDTSINGLSNSGQLHLQGEDADIMINDRSLMGILDSIEQRLGLLKCREDLEKDWHDLKELGDRYREKVKHIEEKVKIWDALKR